MGEEPALPAPPTGHRPEPVIRISTRRSAPAVIGTGDRPSLLETARMAVADPDTHIERVWPMCSPPTEPVEACSSAHFHVDRAGSPPPGIIPVVGLQMSEPYAHEPVMAAEVADLFAPVPPGLVVDATLGGAGHAARILEANPGVRLLGIDRDPAALEAASAALARFGDRAVVRRSRFDDLGSVVRQVQAELGTAGGVPGLSGVLFDLGVSSPSSTWPNGASPTGATPPSTCGWTRRWAAPPPTW